MINVISILISVNLTTEPLLQLLHIILLWISWTIAFVLLVGDISPAERAAIHI